MRAAIMTWKRLHQELSGRRKLPIAIIPVGSFEQHGPHLPLSTDAILAEEIAGRVEERLARQVVLFPPVYYSCSAEHGEIPGTISIDYDSFIQYTEDCVEALFQTGFADVAIINSHGGNISILSVLQRKLNFTRPRKGTLHIFNTIDDGLAGRFFDGRGLFHAGFVETSMVEAVDPRLVDVSELRKMRRKDFMAGKNEGIFRTIAVSEVSPSGMVDVSKPFEHGDAKKGELMVTEMVQSIAKEIIVLNRRKSR